MKKTISLIINNFIIIVIVIAAIIGFAVPKLQKNKLFRLKEGTIFITHGYEGDKENKVKVLAIDESNGQMIYSIKVFNRDNPDYTTTKDGQKVDLSGIGHLPMTAASLAKWDIKVIGFEEVKEEELEGYKMWKEAGAGGF